MGAAEKASWDSAIKGEYVLFAKWKKKQPH